MVSYLVLATLVSLPFVQTWIAQKTADALQQKIGTKVCVGRIDLGLLNRIIIDDVKIYDRQAKEMICASRLAAKISLPQLIANGRISVTSAQAFGLQASFYRQHADSQPNYQFLLDSLSSGEKKTKSSINLSISSLIIRHGSFKYDQHDVPHTSGRINPRHLNVSDISAHLVIPCLTPDSVALVVKKLSLNEASGLALQRLHFCFEANRNHALLTDFNLALPHSLINIDKVEARYNMKGDAVDMGSMKWQCHTNDCSLTLADLACICPALNSFQGNLAFHATIDGKGYNATLHQLNLNSDDARLQLSLQGTVRHMDTREPDWTLQIKQLDCDVEKTMSMVAHILPHEKPLPMLLKHLGIMHFTGKMTGKGLPSSVDGILRTDIGQLTLQAQRQGKGFAAKTVVNNLNIGTLIDNSQLGKLSATVNCSCASMDNLLQQMKVEAAVTHIDYNDYPYRNISLKANANNNMVDGLLGIDDPNIQVDMNANITMTDSHTAATISGSVKQLDPAQLHLSDQWKGATLGFDINAQANIDRRDIVASTGQVSINSLVMQSQTGTYRLEHLDLLAKANSITMQSDFGFAELTGQFKPAQLAQSFNALLHSKMPSLFNASPGSSNRAHLYAEINNSDWLNAFFKIPLQLKSPLNLRAVIDDENQLFSLKCRADRFAYDGKDYEYAFITADTPGDSLTMNAWVRKIMDKGKQLNCELQATMSDDRLGTTVRWSNANAHQMSGYVTTETQFLRNDKGKPYIYVDVKPSDIHVNDTVWHVKPANIIYDDGNLFVDHFSIEHNQQHIKVWGTATKSQNDSITIDLKDVDVNYILDLVHFRSVDFKGNATGQGFIKSVFQEPEMRAALQVKQFRFQDGSMGNLHANVEWNKKEKQIDIDAIADEGNGRHTLIKGYVSPPRNFIDLGLKAKDTSAEFLEGFCGSFIGDVETRLNGEGRLVGSLDSINLVGQFVADGRLKIKPLNTVYQLRNDTIRLLPDNIMFSNDTIYDRVGNIAIVNGALRHKHLTRLTYDLDIALKNLLCYDTHGYDNGATFYGTAYATGNCSIKGRSGRLDIDLDVTPEKGSFIEYDAASPEAISDQQFITWHDKTLRPDNNAMNNDDAAADDYGNISSDMHINFRINMTPDATLRVRMDKNTGDCIALNGTGSLRATYFNKGSFDMFGTYLIDHGTYRLTIQNLMKRMFQFSQGGTIVFGGDPFNANLGLKAVYTINSVPLSDLQIGNSFSTNNVRVDCIMDITGTPKSPKLDFNIDMPTVSDDAEQMVRTLMNSEEEMNQQVVYLLGVGRFYVQKNNNAAEQDQQNQTSLAMQSLLSGTISQQINTLLGNLVKDNNWSFGANISTGNEGFNNAEYEGLLSGRLLNNRLVINGQFGYRDNPNATTSFIGDFDINYLLLPNGNIALKVYNQTNDRYFTKSSLNTQGIGILLKKDFNNWLELFGWKKRKPFFWQKANNKSKDGEYPQEHQSQTP